MPSLYVGIDIGKTHYAALVSVPLLKRHKALESCPVMKVENTLDDFERLYAAMREHTRPGNCHILLEKTGHYGAALEQYLLERGMHVYRIQRAHRYGQNKSDQADAQALAGIAFAQIEQKTLVIDRRLQIYPVLPATPVARMLRGLVRHRHELTQELTRRKNKLTAIVRELFPEFTEVYMDVYSPSALNLLKAFPTPQAIACAALDDLCATRLRHRPARADLARLQELAVKSIGTHDANRQYSLMLEQSMLITEMQLLSSHQLQLEDEISKVVEQSREGRILTSFIGIGPIHAAVLLSGIGCIANFESAAKLRGYLGWAPRNSQTGVSYDSSTLNRAGNGLQKQTMYFVALNAVKNDPSWRALYERLVERKCPLDARTGKRRGKSKVIGRIAGQFINVMFTLLRRDYDLVHAHAGPEPLPEPELYDAQRHLLSVHKSHDVTLPSEMKAH